MPPLPLPKFVEMPGVSLPVQPPFPFEGMSARAFPLRASLGSLQRFVDSYLNHIPPELGRFRVPAPFVTLMLLDYGRMAIEVGNYGWLAQREILFSIPLEWYKVVNGKWQFHDWATIAPFIYVDDELSMTVGRTVYGWPKTNAALEPTTNDWLRDAKAPVREALVRTSVFSELYSGKRLEMKPLLEVQRDAPMSHLRLPFDPNSPLAPWTIARNLAESVVGLSRDAVGLLAGLGVMPTHPGASTDNYLAMVNRLAKMVVPTRPNLCANTINLKQFRRAERPDEYAYQAVTNAPMRLTAYNAGGMMGEERLLAGDASGGYSVIMHRWPSLPIVETLGLEVARQWKGTGCDVAVLKPVAPYWFNVDMEYSPGTNLAWRSHEGIWNGPDGRKYPLTVGSDRKEDKLFNTTLGSANRTVAGPFHFTNTTIRVLPLLAWKDTLQGFLNTTYNEALSPGDCANNLPMSLWAPDEGEFAHVYLVATSVGEVTSTSDNVGDWANYELSFLIPIRRFEMKEGKPVFVGVGVVSAFTFVDNATAAAANTEVLGIPTTSAGFVVPENQWMSLDGPSSDVVQSLLQVRAEVLPAVGLGEKAQQRTILRVESGRPAELDVEEDWRSLADTWGNILKSELRRKRAISNWHVTQNTQESEQDVSSSLLDAGRRLALEVLGNGMPVSYYTLKQYRDVAEPFSACYQSLVRVQRTLTEVLDLREIEEPLTVFIHDYPTRPVAQLLGLVGQQMPGDGMGIIFGLQPQRPFWMSVTMDESLGENVEYRAGGQGWTASRALPTFFGDTEHVRVPDSAVDMLDQGDARRLTRAAREGGSAQVTPSPTLHISAESALLSLDPQIILESLLSREWGNWSEDARWRAGRRSLEARYAERLAGVSEGGVARMESQFFSEILAEVGRRPGEPPVRRVEAMVTQLKAFGETRLSMEHTWEKLASLVGRSGVLGAPSPGPVTAAAIADARHEFLELVTKIARTPITGIADSPGKPADYRPSADHSRLSDANMRLFELLLEEYRAFENALRVATGVPPWKHADAAAPESTKAAHGAERLDLEELLKRLQAMDANIPATAASESPDSPGETADKRMQRLRDETVARRDTLRELVRLSRERCDMQREALFNELSRAAQKPDHVVWRGATGTERDRMFPLAQSWDESWYVGAEARTPMVTSAPGPDQSVG
ncbi:MAG: hypothetical protein IPP90_10655 [Gemmatimonadaceae bacterium]|nr:hypothetical protein [Gemmatimonadaceae bacterium]